MLNKILVTGARGFLGSHFVEAFQDMNVDVAGTYHNTDHKSKPSEYMSCDLTISEDCERVTEDVQTVIHCAASTFGAKMMKEHPQLLVTPNILMNVNLLDAAHRNKVKTFVFISSSAVYPDLPDPMTESRGFEGDPPESYFGVAWVKRYTEKLCQFYERLGMKIIILRPGQLIGPHMKTDENAHMVPSLIKRALKAENPFVVWGDPETTRDFIDARDFVQIALDIIQNEPGGTWNIGSGNGTTTQQIVESIQKFTGPLNVQYDQSKPTTIKTRRLDITKADKYINKQTLISLDKTIADMIHYQHDHLPVAR